MPEEAVLDPALVDPAKLQPFLTATLGSDRPLTGPVYPQAGVSNIVAFMKWGDEDIVVRRAPPGPIPPGANNLIREYDLLKALQGRVRVPKVLVSCADPEVIGAPFFIMERIDGFVPAMGMPDAFTTPAMVREVAFEFVDALAELHNVDYREVGLANFARPEGFVERQIRRRFEALEGIMARCRQVPEMVTLHAWLEQNAPPQNPDFSIVHGDYHLRNVMFAPEPPPVLTAMIDWEIATIGDPLTDLGTVLTSPGSRQVWEMEGYPTDDELTERYEEGRGKPAESVVFYRVLALWRLGVAMEGNYARFVDRNDPRQETTKNSCPDLAARALEIAGI